MRNFSYKLGIVLLLAVACTKTTVVEEIQYRNPIYTIDTVAVYADASQKTKLKSSTQFYSILYADLFGKPLPATTATGFTVLTVASGDKQAMRELIISNLINDAGARIPTQQEANSDQELFVRETYLRFLQRYPTATELAYTLHLMNEEDLDPTQVYQGFSLSTEYLYY